VAPPAATVDGELKPLLYSGAAGGGPGGPSAGQRTVGAHAGVGIINGLFFVVAELAVVVALAWAATRRRPGPAQWSVHRRGTTCELAYRGIEPARAVVAETVGLTPGPRSTWDRIGPGASVPIGRTSRGHRRPGRPRVTVRWCDRGGEHAWSGRVPARRR
jgi:hypothetical protein